MTYHRKHRRTGTAAWLRHAATISAAAAVAAAGIAACGSSNATHSTTTGGSAPNTVTAPTTAPATTSARTSTTASATQTATTRSSATTDQTTASVTPCATAQLTGSVGPGSGAGMSQNRVSLILKNTSSSTCTLYGYPGVSWATSANGDQVGPGAARYNLATPKRVTLAPGDVASAPLDIVEGNGGLSTSECHPRPVSGLRVYPPNDTEYLFIPEKLSDPGACSVKTQSPMLQIGFMHPGADASSDES